MQLHAMQQFFGPCVKGTHAFQTHVAHKNIMAAQTLHAHLRQHSNMILHVTLSDTHISVAALQCENRFLPLPL